MTTHFIKSNLIPVTLGQVLSTHPLPWEILGMCQPEVVELGHEAHPVLQYLDPRGYVEVTLLEGRLKQFLDQELRLEWIKDYGPPAFMTFNTFGMKWLDAIVTRWFSQGFCATEALRIRLASEIRNCLYALPFGDWYYGLPETCPICLEAMVEVPRRTRCQHEFHARCLADWMCSSSQKTCPLCRQIISE